jgi:hypothetical protein
VPLCRYRLKFYDHAVIDHVTNTSKLLKMQALSLPVVSRNFLEGNNKVVKAVIGHLPLRGIPSDGSFAQVVCRAQGCPFGGLGLHLGNLMLMYYLEVWLAPTRDPVIDHRWANPIALPLKKKHRVHSVRGFMHAWGRSHLVQMQTTGHRVQAKLYS